MPLLFLTAKWMFLVTH